jgi:hypothetical protein
MSTLQNPSPLPSNLGFQSSNNMEVKNFFKTDFILQIISDLLIQLLSG